MPRRAAAVTHADVPTSARKVLRSTIVTDGYHALFDALEQRITDDVDIWGLAGAAKAHRLKPVLLKKGRVAEAPFLFEPVML